MKSYRIFLITALIGFHSSFVFAYTDRVDAKPQEIFDAAKISFGKEGIYKQDPAKLTLTTRWVNSRIRRARKRLFVPLQLKENVNLRSQMEIKIEEQKNYTQVSIQGRFEEKATDAPPQQPWKKALTSKELYFKEREAFFKILTTLEAQKKATHPSVLQTN